MEGSAITELWMAKNLELRRAADDEYADVFRGGRLGSSVELEKDIMVYSFLVQVYEHMGASHLYMQAINAYLHAERDVPGSGTLPAPEEIPPPPVVSDAVLQTVNVASALIDKLHVKLSQARDAYDVGDTVALEAVTWEDG